MSYVQCKDQDEVEVILGKSGSGFITEDHRIYDKIHLADDALIYTFDAKTVLELMNLQTEIRMLGESGERSFLELEEHAKSLTATFKKVQKLIQTSPIEKKP